MILSEKFIESSIVGILSTVIGQLGVSYYLDPMVGTHMSNIIGLVIEAILDFFGQEYAFTGKTTTSAEITKKFIIGKVISITLSQLLFLLILPKLKLVRSIFGNWTLTAGRLFVGSVIFLIITYPLRKYWVFKKNPPLKKNVNK